MTTKALANVLVCCLLAGIPFSNGRPIDPRLSFTKTATSRPTEGVSTQKPEEQPTYLDDCSQFCSQTYPQHTYPTPSHHKACVTGCRSAQVNALIAWPYKSPFESCALACSESYPSSSEEQYACTTGCNASTIDSLFPDRELIYSNKMADNSSFSGDPALLNQASDLMDFVFNTFFQSFSLDSDIERLTVHANQMNQLLPPVKSSMVTYVIQDDDVMELREYSFQGGITNNQDSNNAVFDFVNVPMFENDVVAMSDSKPGDNNKVSSSSSQDGYKVYHRPSSSSRRVLCQWYIGRVNARRVLMGISVVFIGLSILVCCLGMVRKDPDVENRRIKRKLQTPFVGSHTPSTVKVPLDVRSEYQPDRTHLMVPVHVKVGGVKGVEGVMTVVT